MAVNVPTCDFCGVAGAVCYFPCTPFKLMVDDPRIPSFPSGDRFHACAVCRPLVEARKWAELRRYCTQVDIFQAVDTHGVRALWSGFAANRQGPSVDLPAPDPPEHLHIDADIRGAAAHWHHVCDVATAVVNACTTDEEGLAADPAKVPGATPDAVAAMDELRAAVAGPDARKDGMALHEVDAAARRVSAALPVQLSAMVAGLVDAGGGEPELALMGAVMMLNGALHGLDEALDRLDPGDDD